MLYCDKLAKTNIRGGDSLDPTAILPTYMSELKMQNNIRVLIHNDHRIVYQIDCVDGTGTVEVLTLFPGVVLQFHSFHCKSFQLSESKEVGNSLKINYCTEGRMEVRMSDNLLLFMEPGNLSIDVRKAQDSFQFPCGHYHGMELLFHSSTRNHEARKSCGCLEWMENKCSPAFARTHKAMWYGQMIDSRNCLKI